MSTEFYRRQTENQHEKFIVLPHTDPLDKPPSRYYIVDALQHFVFIVVRDRLKAQSIVDEIYGESFYRVRYIGLEPVSGKEISAR
jgi:hypothetical protein